MARRSQEEPGTARRGQEEPREGARLPVFVCNDLTPPFLQWPPNVAQRARARLHSLEGLGFHSPLNTNHGHKEQGGANRGQVEPGRARESQEEPGRARKSQEESGGARRIHAGPGGARRGQE